MSLTSTTHRTALFILLVLMNAPGVARAEAYPRAEAQAAKSLTSALGVSTLTTVRRQRADPNAVVAQLTAAVCNIDCAGLSKTATAGRIRVRGMHWHLDVMGDGSVAEFVDETVGARAHAVGVQHSAAISRTALEAMGRAYIASHLSSTIVLRPNETLVAEAASTRLEGGSSSAGVQDSDVVTGLRVVFSREIDGIPVVGLGSKVMLTFLNDGSLESFRYDWPMYASTGVAQATIAAQDVMQRLQQVVGRGSDKPNLYPPPPPLTPSGALDLKSDVQLQRLECGYYDAGFLSRDSSVAIQAGCVYHALQYFPGSHVGVAGLSGAVPAAAQPDPDGQWREEALLRGVIASGGSSPPSAATPGQTSMPAPPRQP